MRSGPKPMPAVTKGRPVMPPDLLRGVPDPPDWCKEPDAALWWRTCQTLIDRQQLTTGDLKAVESFVLAWSMVDAARSEGRHRDTDKFLLSACKLGRELGLSPNSRDRTPITQTELEPLDDLERFKAGDFD